MKYAEPPSIFAHSANIAKGESRSKRETKFHELIMLSRLLYSTNIAKGEGRSKRETKFYDLIMPNRSILGISQI